MERLCIFIHIYNKPYISLWPIRSQFDMDLARAPRRARLTARKKGSGYENELQAKKPDEYNYFKKIWDLREQHMVKGLPEKYIFFCYLATRVTVFIQYV